MSDRVAVLVTAHGFGHLTRQLAIGAALRDQGIEPVFYTAAPRLVLAGTLADPDHVTWAIDVGLAQPDSLRVDLARTQALLAERCSDPAVDRLAAHLAGQDLMGVIADAPPPGLEAARRAGLPAVAVANFDWAWIYDHFPALAPWAARFRAWQAPHQALHLWPGPGLTGFQGVTEGPLVGRRRPAHVFPDTHRHVLVSFGGLGLADLDRRLPQLPGVRWVLAPPMAPLERPDVFWVRDVPYPALVAGVDAVLTKPGYGILAEAMLAGTPLAWLPRQDWPETPFLAEPMAARGDVKVTGGVDAALATLWSRPRPVPHARSGSGAELAAGWILDQLVQAGGLKSPSSTGSGVADPLL